MLTKNAFIKYKNTKLHYYNLAIHFEYILKYTGASQKIWISWKSETFI